MTSSNMKIKVSVWRQAGPNAPGAFKDYNLDNVSPEMSFLEMLDTLNEQLTHKGEEPVAFDPAQGYQMLRELVRYLQTVAAQRPLVIVLEDMHWGDAASWDALEYVMAQLTSAGMSVENLAKVTIFLSDRKHAIENRQARKAALGDQDRSVALTVIITGIFDSAWLLEIEAVAAR